jgi:ATP-binding cassette subfamily B protein
MLRVLASCIGSYRKSTLLTPLFVIGEVILEVLIPLIMASLIDQGIQAGSVETVKRLGLLLAGAALISLVFGVLAGHFAAKASAGFARNLRKKMFYRVQDFSFITIDRFSTASLVTRLTSDVTRIQQAFGMLIRIAVRSPVMLVFSLVMAFSINSRLSLVFLLTMPLLGFGLYLIMTRAHPLFKRVFKTYDRLSTVVQENLRGIRVVKSFVRSDHEQEKFSTVSDSIFRDFSKAERLIALNMPLMQFAVYLCILLLSWFGARMIVSDTLTTGQLVSLIAYTTQILRSLMLFSMVMVMITISRASAERTVEVITAEEDLREPDNPVTVIPNADITFDQVCFSYGRSAGQLVLDTIELEIKSGESVGILGGTGSSKSSLVQLIPRLYDVTSGRVLIGGIDVREYSIQRIRSAVSVVLQKSILFSGTISENLRWGNEHAEDSQLERACRIAEAHEFICSFEKGYETYIEQDGSNISGGQRQRICIARALLAEPKILILDDATSAVDTRTESRIHSALRKELPGTTLLIITQRVASVIDADRIVLMDHGQISDIGTHEQLMEENELYREISTTQMQGGQSNDAS